ncbi:oxygen-independent coproporphyrinogen III oxidase [Granulosicoccus antarcticus]|nr:oxygen-independent coproporphyrinogen III oxidase [Granulosicoccus antarcticus]
MKEVDIRAPRYTSYPTADRFVEAFGPEDYIRHLQAREMRPAVPLSVYVHIPFCSALCYYCACSKKITRNYEKAERYVRHLVAELSLVDARLGGDRRLLQLHLGGGTPTFLKERELRILMSALREHYALSSSGEYSIEVDPRTVDDEKMALLSELGFNRISLGVQDFDRQVQTAINRVQPETLVQSVLDRARSLGFESTNFDLIYGLPRQTLAGFEKTIDSVIAMRPDRIALYSYAHMPLVFKSQRLISINDMPNVATSQAVFRMANERLEAAGYEYIGMDHYALPDDPLAKAHRNGLLHRNFQGYTTQPDCDLVALGSSSISRIGSCYSQNQKSTNDYNDCISQGILPTQRGLELSRDDMLRRAIIMAIMCQGEVDKETFEVNYLIDFNQYFAEELLALEPLMQAGMVDDESSRIVVTATGRREALRLISACFDRYLSDQKSRARYSKVL